MTAFSGSRSFGVLLARGCGRALLVAVAGAAAFGALAGAAPASVTGSGGWMVQKSPNPGSCCNDNSLAGVAAISASSAWVVGNYSNGTAAQTLIERWNGKAWKVQKSPDVGGSSENNYLASVAAVSPSDAWAVGYYYSGSVALTLVEHWNGRVWKIQKNPNRGLSSAGDYLDGVVATGRGNVWAVGAYYNAGRLDQTLVEHWNGKVWKIQKSPNPGGSTGGNYLRGVAATSASKAWAVGDYYSNGTTDRTLVERWNGKAWKVQKSPNPGGSSNTNELYGVTATSATNAWAVGDYFKFVDQTLIEHWNGKVWKVQKSPNPRGSGADNSLAGVAATSARSAWAVGNYSDGTAEQTLVEHRADAR